MSERTQFPGAGSRRLSADDLLPVVDEELRCLARSRMLREQPSHTLQPSAPWARRKPRSMSPLSAPAVSSCCTPFGGGGARQLQFDDIRLAGDWESLVVVPEPSTAFLLGFAGAGALLRRRRVRP